MTKTIWAAAVLGGAAMAAASPVWAHHSHAMFDTGKNTVITGTVKGYEFANPHVQLYLLVDDPSGAPVLYPVEMSFTQNMEHDGVGPKTFKPGDKVQVRVYPYRNGKPGGSYNGAIDAQGGKHGSMADKPERAG